MNKRPSEHELETGLQRMFPAPDAIFVNGLEERLLQQAAAQFRPAERRRWVDVFRARTWATAAVAVALAIIAIVAVVGPQETLAAVQRLIGYIPGIGFVENPQQTWRVLSEPVAVERDGVTVTVEKLLAGAESTQVRLRVDGLPLDKSLYETGIDENDESRLPLVMPNPELIAGGERLISTYAVSGAGDFVWAEYVYPPLPAGIENVTLFLPRIPGLAAGVAPEDWTIELSLQEAAAGGMVAATAEPRASELVNQARLWIESVAAMPDQTVLKVRLISEIEGREPAVDWRAETWGQPSGLDAFGLSLTDDRGQSYPLTREETLQATGDRSTVLLAPALDPSRRYTLRLEGANFEYRFNGMRQPSFRLDVPDGSEPGSAWTVDETFEAAGFSFHVAAAELRPGYGEQIVLALTIDPVPGITGIGLSCADLEVCSSSGFFAVEPGQTLQTEVYLHEIPTGALLLQPQVIHETVAGPWEVQFWVE